MCGYSPLKTWWFQLFPMMLHGLRQQRITNSASSEGFEQQGHHWNKMSDGLDENRNGEVRPR